MTKSQNLTELANQMFVAAAAASSPAEADSLRRLAEDFSEQAAVARVAEGEKRRTDAEFWASQNVVTNWVG